MSKDVSFKPGTTKYDPLKGYFLVKKYSDGWLMCSQTGPETRFVTREELIKMGLIPRPPIDRWKKFQNPPVSVIKVPVRKSLPVNTPTETSDEIIISEINLDNVPPIRSASCPDRDVTYLKNFSEEQHDQNMDIEEDLDEDIIYSPEEDELIFDNME